MAMSFLSATTLYVGHDQQYTTIQSAVNVANNGDVIVLSPETFNESVNLNLFSEGNLIIRSTHPEDPETVNSTKITTQSQGIDIFSLSSCIIDNNIILDGLHISQGQSGLRIYDLSADVKFEIYNCIFDYNDNGIQSSDENGMIIGNCIFKQNKFYGILNEHSWISNILAIRIFNSLIIDNGNFGIKSNMDVDINNCTVVTNGAGLILLSGKGEITNSIFYNNNIEINNPNDSLTVSFSDVKGGYSGVCNIDKDPKLSGNVTYESHLVEGSPCIDAGDPNLTDADGTRLDMGCFSTADLDLKELQGNHWNWVSFPRLPRENNDPVNAPSILEQMLYGLPNIDLKDKNLQHLTYTNQTWNNPGYSITSDNGYKLYFYSGIERTLPEHGTRLPANFTTPIYANQRNWVGYWLPQTQSVYDALGSQLDHIIGIKAENWYMKKIDGQWYGLNSVKATFEYGKGYEIITDRDIDLQWHYSHLSPGFKSEPTENFTYTQKADYEMLDIDAVDGADNVTEIGAFVDGVCVGSSKVTEYPVHILAYTDAVNRGSEFSFEVVTGRGVEKINNTQKYNFATAKFENVSVYPTGSGFSRVRLSIKSNGNESVSPIKLESNYPNPFSISGKRGSIGTTIAFTIPEKQNVKITIYNIKGQKVKSLLDKNCAKGRTSIIWNGKDDSNKTVSSGVYFYRLETKHQSFNKKMILVK